MNSWSNLGNISESVRDNFIGLDKRGQEDIAKARQMLNIPEERKVSLEHQWDGSVRVYSDGFCLGIFKLPNE